jgi:hypothetical protein
MGLMFTGGAVQGVHCDDGGVVCGGHDAALWPDTWRQRQQHGRAERFGVVSERRQRAQHRPGRRVVVDAEGGVECDAVGWRLGLGDGHKHLVRVCIAACYGELQCVTFHHSNVHQPERKEGSARIRASTYLVECGQHDVKWFGDRVRLDTQSIEIAC